MGKGTTVVKVLRFGKIDDGENEVPAWVMDAWVGLILPCAPRDEVLSQCEGEELKSGNDIYFVRQDIAITELRKKLPAAAQWHYRFGEPKPGMFYTLEEKNLQILR